MLLYPVRQGTCEYFHYEEQIYTVLRVDNISNILGCEEWQGKNNRFCEIYAGEGGAVHLRHFPSGDEVYQA